MKTKISLILSVVMLLGLLAACGGGSYKDDVAVSQLESAIDEAIGGGNTMIQAPETYVSTTMKLDAANYAEACIKMDSQGVNINEYGVFKAADESSAKALKTMLDSYLKFRQDSWAPEYMPEELPKLQNATVTVKGSYVMYAILSEEARSAAESAFENALKA